MLTIHNATHSLQILTKVWGLPPNDSASDSHRNYLCSRDDRQRLWEEVIWPRPSQCVYCKQPTQTMYTEIIYAHWQTYKLHTWCSFRRSKARPPQHVHRNKEMCSARIYVHSHMRKRRTNTTNTHKYTNPTMRFTRCFVYSVHSRHNSANVHIHDCSKRLPMIVILSSFRTR